MPRSSTAVRTRACSRPRRRAEDWGWRLLYVGRVDSRKGIETAIAALAELPRQATLAVYGRGDPGHLAELRARAEGLGLGGPGRVRRGRARPARRRLRGRGRGRLPGRLARALGPRPARGDVGRPPGGGDGHRRLRRVPARRRELPDLRPCRRRPGARRRPAQPRRGRGPARAASPGRPRTVERLERDSFEAAVERLCERALGSSRRRG